MKHARVDIKAALSPPISLSLYPTHLVLFLVDCGVKWPRAIMFWATLVDVLLFLSVPFSSAIRFEAFFFLVESTDQCPKFNLI